MNVARQMQRNANLGICDFYLVEDQEGKVDFTGTMDLERVLEIVKAKVLEQKSCDMSTWVPSKPLPKLPASLEQVFKVPDLLKKTSNSYIEWLLAKQNVKRVGDGNFVGWSFPIDRQLFVVNDKALSAFSGPTFSLEQIVPWSSLKGLKNGFQAGARNLLLPQSSIKAWLAFLRIFFEVC